MRIAATIAGVTMAFITRTVVAYSCCRTRVHLHVSHGLAIQPSVGDRSFTYQQQQLFHGDLDGVAHAAPVDGTAVPLDSTSDPPVKQKIKIVLDESELEERFVRATGNGGQKVNKSSSKVVLVHRPTGLITSCQDARDLSTNRRIARKLMIDKLDLHFNMELSKIGMKQELSRKRKRNSTRKAKKKYGSTDSGSTIEEDDDDDDDGISEEELELIRFRTR